MRTENLAIVFIDIAGFTPRTSNQTREENLWMLKRFDGIVRPLVRSYAEHRAADEVDVALVAARVGIAAVAACPNVHVKLGGIGMPRTGFDWHARSVPIGSHHFMPRGKYGASSAMRLRTLSCAMIVDRCPKYSLPPT